MDKLKSSPIVSARDFFASEIQAAMLKHQVSASSDSFEYLVELLLGHLESDKFFEKSADGKLRNVVVAELYASTLQADEPQRFALLKRLGDICLIISGFFAESVHRKVTDLGYYFGMGGAAYGELANMQLAKKPREVYDELSKNFSVFSNVLSEVSEKSGLQSNADLLRMYERWLFTGSDRLKSILSERGITVPTKVDLKVKH